MTVPTSTAHSPGPRAPLWQRLWRRPVFKRGFYEALGLLLLRHRGLQMLNCGYHDPGAETGALALPPSLEVERLGFQLYRRLVRATPLAGRDVIEIGCGRGGGARLLAAELAPRRYTATDASRMLILGTRALPRPANLEFRAGRADRLPAQDASFDIALTVEAVHPLPDKLAFLREAARVLRPGGALLIADFFYTRETSPHALAGFRRTVADSPLALEAEEDWTEPAASALELDSPRRLAEIDRLPALLRRPALAFAGTTQSPLYRQLRDGRARYAYFRLRQKQAD